MFVYGKNSVLEILKVSPEKVGEIALQEGGNKRLAEIATLAHDLGIKTKFVKEFEIQRKCRSHSHQGVMATVIPYKYFPLEEIVAKWKKSGEKALFLILDEITDPHNLGAITRSAEILGGSGIIIPKDRAVRVTPTVHKVSTGAVLHFPIAMVTNISEAIKMLKKEGIWIVGTSPDAGTYLQDFNFSSDIAIVIGSERRGVRKHVQKNTCILFSNDI